MKNKHRIGLGKHRIQFLDYFRFVAATMKILALLLSVVPSFGGSYNSTANVMCPDGGPDGGSRECPPKTQCCTCRAEEGWTTGGCVPEGANCCGDSYCVRDTEIKCCAYFALPHGGNSLHFQCYNKTMYECPKGGGPPQPIGDVVDALSRQLRAREARATPGLGPLLSCD